MIIINDRMPYKRYYTNKKARNINNIAYTTIV